MFDLNDIEGRQQFSIRLSELRTDTLFTKEKRESKIKEIAEYRFQNKIHCNDCSKIKDVIKEIKYDKSLLHIEEWINDEAEKPLTQYSLGKIIGRGRTTITAWESGKNIPEYTELYMLCTIFDVDVGYLLGDIECHKYSEQKIVDITGLNKKSSEVILSLSNDKIKLLDNILINDGFKLILNYLRDLIIPDNSVDRVLSEKYINDDLSEFQYSTIIRRYGDSRKICKYNASLQFGNLINELDDVFFEEKYGVTFDDIRLEFLDKFFPEELSKDKYEAFLNE